jgi:hypothetical protein
VCGTNYVWLDVAHNRLSLPLSGSRSECDARFDDLDVAKWTCQSIAECRGITRDHGVTCDGVVKIYELRRGVLWDTTPDDAFNSWVRRDFWRRTDTDLVDVLPDEASDPCPYRFERLEAATAACRMTEGCHGVVEDGGVSCDGERRTFELRSGGQTEKPGSTAWIYRVRPAAD